MCTKRARDAERQYLPPHRILLEDMEEPGGESYRCIEALREKDAPPD
jgi:hypothetical protein